MLENDIYRIRSVSENISEVELGPYTIVSFSRGRRESSSGEESTLPLQTTTFAAEFWLYTSPRLSLTCIHASKQIFTPQKLKIAHNLSV